MDVREWNLRRLVEENRVPAPGLRGKQERYRRLQRELAALEAAPFGSHAEEFLQLGRGGAADFEIEAFAHAYFGAASEDGA
ncbi:hypothetical protein METEAL_17160 [Mesoterricola silvestris]|uniref:Uncharacterized protein n=1 Tax=Mesoterricola silvestris TaxID=2927979 RepID=A0AA48GR80_9BACT|nr:hypothetical protein METEAL_17160 [Mesoterricola silvestris]